jgi:hypothetical protein
MADARAQRVSAHADLFAGQKDTKDLRRRQLVFERPAATRARSIATCSGIERAIWERSSSVKEMPASRSASAIVAAVIAASVAPSAASPAGGSGGVSRAGWLQRANRAQRAGRGERAEGRGGGEQLASGLHRGDGGRTFGRRLIVHGRRIPRRA